MAYKGLFIPKNPQKYRGDHTNIIYRSSWECKVMSWLDNNDNILSWASEELIVPYISPVDNRKHRYFPDFIVKARTKDGTVKTMMLEVKPKYQTYFHKLHENKDLDLLKDLYRSLIASSV